MGSERKLRTSRLHLRSSSNCSRKLSSNCGFRSVIFVMSCGLIKPWCPLRAGRREQVAIHPIVNHLAEQPPATGVSSSNSFHTGIHLHPTSEPVRYLGSLNTSILLLAHMSWGHHIENRMFSWSWPFNRESFSGRDFRILCAELTRLPRANKWKHMELHERRER